MNVKIVVGGYHRYPDAGAVQRPDELAEQLRVTTRLSQHAVEGDDDSFQIGDLDMGAPRPIPPERRIPH